MLSLTTFLRSTCTISRKTPTIATNGETTNAWSDFATGVPCTVQAMRAFEQTQANRESGVVEFEVYFLPGTDIRSGDKLTTLANSAVASSDTLEVTSPAADDGGEQGYVRITARLTKGSDVR